MVGAPKNHSPLRAPHEDAGRACGENGAEAMSRPYFPPLPKQDLDHVLSGTLGCWEKLKGNRIFVTGATGFFGKWLLETFAHANDVLGLGAELVGLSRDTQAFARRAPHLAAHPAIRLLQGDVRGFEFPKGPFSHVIHAGTTSSAPVPPLEMLDTIVDGTRRTLDFAVASGAADFLLVSSGAVYGRQPETLTHIAEDYSGAPDPADPNAAYGEGKRVAELLGAVYRGQKRLRVKTARCFAFVGPHLPLDAHFAVGNFIRDALRGGPVVVNGDGSPVRSYLYAGDLAVWLWRMLLGEFEGVCNVGSAEALSILELARLVAETLGPGLEVRVARPATGGGTGPRHQYVPDCGRAKAELGVSGGLPLGLAVLRTARYYQGTEQRK
jgi:nucleoside-diphosphate-sugar epimerase